MEHLPDKARIEPQHKPPIPLPTITTSYFFIKYILYSSRKTNAFQTNVFVEVVILRTTARKNI